MADKTITVAFCMKASDVDVLRRLQDAVSEQDGERVSASLVVRRALRLLARKMKVQ